MKKIIISLLIIIGIILTGWLLKDVTISNNYAENERFIKIKDEGYFDIVYDVETKVEYAVSQGKYNKGIFTLLVDKDGKPLIYGGE